MLLAVFCCLDFSTVENAIYNENVAVFNILEFHDPQHFLLCSQGNN